MSLHSMNMRFQ